MEVVAVFNLKLDILTERLAPRSVDCAVSR